MQQENVEILRHGLDAFNRRDKAAFIALCDSGCENFPPREWPESAPIRGAEAIWDFFVETVESWEDGSFDWGELIDAGNEKVVANQRGELQGKASGAAVTWSYWVVFTFRDGKIVRWEWFADQAEALDAAGRE